MSTTSLNVQMYAECKLTVSFMTIGMEGNDEWCAEIISDPRRRPEEVKCFHHDEYRNKE